MTTTEYNEYGQVVKVTTVDEYEERPNYTFTVNSPNINLYGTYTVNGNGEVNPPALD